MDWEWLDCDSLSYSTICRQFSEMSMWSEFVSNFLI